MTEIKNYVKEYAQDILSDSRRLADEMSAVCPKKKNFYEKRVAAQSAKIEKIVAMYYRGIITTNEAMQCLAGMPL